MLSSQGNNFIIEYGAKVKKNNLPEIADGAFSLSDKLDCARTRREFLSEISATPFTVPRTPPKAACTER
jgi:hypothetical protein